MKEIMLKIIAAVAFLVICSCEIPTDANNDILPDDSGSSDGTPDYILEDHTLPAGITITAITADSSECSDVVLLAQGAVLLNLTVANSTGADILFNFQAEWLFLADDNDVQDLCIIQSRSVIITPGTNPVYIPTYCIDVDKAVPEETDTFQLAATITTPAVLEVINICSSKVIDFNSFFKVQEIIYNCIRTGSLSSVDSTYLNGLTDM